MKSPVATADLQILILAAGQSRRMRGGDKLMEQVAGEALIRRIAQQALGTCCPVTITLPPDRPERAQAIADLTLQRALVADPAQGMAVSLQAGLAQIPVEAAVMLLLADLPELTCDDLNQIIAQWREAPARIHRGTSADGTPGHPVIFPARLRPDLLAISGDQGARAILRANDVVSVTLPGRHAVTDLDTPEDWAAWRAATHL